MSKFIVIFLLFQTLCPFKLSEAQQLVGSQLDSVNLSKAEFELENILAEESEVSLRQVLVRVSVIQDVSYATSFVYDLYIDFDPTRYQNARVGIYPLKFEEQFVFWGKRVASYTKQISWKSGRFYLHDISTGKIAWIFTADTRRLFNPKQPSQSYSSTSPYTPLNDMSQWLRFIRLESRDSVIDVPSKKHLTIPEIPEKQIAQ